MGWNGSGAITLLYDWSADRDAGIPDAYISADKFDPYMEDIAGAIENTLARDGQNRPSTHINWDAYRIENLGAPTGPLHAVNANSVSLSLYGGTTGGNASNYTLSATYLSSVSVGTTVRMLANHTNTGATTLTISGGVLGSTPIVRSNGSSALTGGEIVSGDFFEVAYDGTSWVLIHTPVEQTGDFVDGTLTVGLDDSLAGIIGIYGGGATESGGLLLLYNAADADTTNEFWGISSTSTNGNLNILRSGASNADMYIANADGYMELGRDGGLVGIGRDDAQSGTLRLYGGASGSSQGGELQIYNDNSNDATVEYYRFEALAGSLVLARGTGSADITISTTGTVTVANDATLASGQAFVGVDDSVPAVLSLYGGGTGEQSAEIRLYNNADDDGTVGYWNIEPVDGTGDFGIARDGGTADLTIDSSGRVTTSISTASTIQDSTTATKEVDVDLAGATASTKTTLDFNQTANRTITFPDATGTVMIHDTADWVLLDTFTIGSSVSTYDIDISGYTAYEQLKITIFDLTQVTDNVTLRVSASYDGGSTFKQAANENLWSFGELTTTSGGFSGRFGGVSSGWTGGVWLQEGWGNAAQEHYTGTIVLLNWLEASANTRLWVDGTGHRSGSAAWTNVSGVAVFYGAADVEDQLRFDCSSGNLDGGTFRIYGRL